MFLEEIIVDGFKSYATRTVISGFDPTFNAITGLNGSGKSNILDAICFVLGITNLSQVRAHTLQELVYKQGQAGVTKATVSIVFNNSDKAQSPVGYAEHDQITVTRQVAIGGHNKYLINGVTAQQNRVQNLFHSVQLNINNPHFLIMQGRITKVINMKPMELLSMVEEAAGTKMYQMKKDAALKTIEKKQAKVEEIERVLAEQITPSLEKLRRERSQYTHWSTLGTECEELSRFCTAYEFHRSKQIVTKAEKETESMRTSMDELARRIQTLTEELKEKTDRLGELKRRRQREESTQLKAIDENVSDLSKDVVKLTRAWENKRDTLEADTAAITKLEKSLKELEASLIEKAQELEAARLSLTQAIEEERRVKEQTEALQQLILSGTASNAAQGEKSLADQLMDAKRRMAQAETEIQQATVRRSHFESELVSKRKAVAAMSQELAKNNAEKNALAKEVAALTQEFASISFDPSLKNGIQQEIKQHTDAIRTLKEKIDTLQSALTGLDFRYADPEPGFDRAKVKGLIAQLIQVKDVVHTTALEVAAGGKLYQVVVDNESTGKALLSRGQLKKRVTIVPLNKIDDRTCSKSSVDAAAKALGKERAKLALSLVGYDADVESAIKYVFGRTIICKDDDAAKTVAFDQSIRCRAVTLAGDVYDPAGTLTGGVRAAAGSSVLARLGELQAARVELAEREAQLAKLQVQAKKYEEAGAHYETASRRADLKKHELNLLEERLKCTASHKLSEEIGTLEQGINDATTTIQASTKAKSAAESEAEVLMAQLGGGSASGASAKSNEEKRRKENDKKLAASKEKQAVCAREVARSHARVEALQLELASAEEERQSCTTQLKHAKSALRELAAEVDTAATAAAAVKARYVEASDEAETRRAILREADSELALLSKDVSRTQEDLSEAKLQAKRVEHKIATHKKDVADSEKMLEVIVKKNPWVESEEQNFGKPRSEFDFSARDPADAAQKLQVKLEERDRVGKKLNKKVMSLFDKAESEYLELVRKKRIIEQDKAKIERVIEELDERKNQALKSTWVKVNRDFGSIFSTLLPGARAKLDPPEDGPTGSVLDGLVFKVGFGECWKESLSELSGGQRSLLALSLILSLLLFKPAPMYILDEIDAALDLSHTQNIGMMLRTHFKKSQFIIVSLKEGMFSNANVLFRTKFVDGVSTVARTTPGIRAR